MYDYTQSWPTEPTRVEKYTQKALELEDGRMVPIAEGPYYTSQSGAILRRVKIEDIEPIRRDRGYQGEGFHIDGGRDVSGSVFQVKDDHAVEWVTYKEPVTQPPMDTPLARFMSRGQLAKMTRETEQREQA